GLFALNLINTPRRPRDHRRIHVAEIPFVSRNLTVRMLVPFTHDQIELLFSELNVDQREWEAMKREVPRCVPGEFPFVRHRHDTLVIKMTPAGIAAAQSFVRRRLARITVEPLVDDVVIELFVPK